MPHVGAIDLVTSVGEGVTDGDGSDEKDEPASFSDTTEKVYATPFDNPATTQVKTVAGVSQVNPPGELVTRYPVIERKFVSGFSHDTDAAPLRGDARTRVGTPGRVIV
jgi:hypothetical protein